jgi:dihydrolipoamide dehydrogenase
MDRMRKIVKTGHDHVRKGIAQAEDMDFFEGEANFVGDYTLDVNGERIKGKKIFIVSGARPFIPPLKGIDTAEYLTNETALALQDRPESLIIIGGGYIAAEFAHFFAAMGTKVTLIQRNKRLVPDEEPEISALLNKELSKRMEIHTNTEAVEIRKSGSGYAVVAKDRESGTEKEFTSQKIMMAAGRQSNADLLKVGNTGVQTDKRGYIVVNDYFETAKKNIWAFGDALGKKMFRHVANKEAGIVWHNAAHQEKAKMDYQSAPHAIFSYPEIASVGLTEEEARKAYPVNELLVGTGKYSKTARGEAMMEEEAFAKAIVKKKDGKILGFHIIGPSASLLIQEVVNVMANNGDMWSIARAMHIHPALSEVIVTTLGNLEELE